MYLDLEDPYKLENRIFNTKAYNKFFAKNLRFALVQEYETGLVNKAGQGNISFHGLSTQGSGANFSNSVI